MKRNPCIEYIRLIACLIVVACHVNFQLASTADTEGLKTFYFCVFSDGSPFLDDYRLLPLSEQPASAPHKTRPDQSPAADASALCALPRHLPAGIFRSNTLITPGMSSYT